MVSLDRIYTGGGDAGQTSIGDGQRVSKLHPRIVAGGSVDELNCAIGAAAAADPNSRLTPLLLQLQQFLFDLGADLCSPCQPAEAEQFGGRRITEQHVQRLETLIDEQVAVLQPLMSFILPGGTLQAAMLHLARSICRRAELDVLRLAAVESVNPHLLVGMNRLSDLLFVLARMANDGGRADVLWQPRQSMTAAN